jgi:hypothetical protein
LVEGQNELNVQLVPETIPPLVIAGGFGEIDILSIDDAYISSNGTPVYPIIAADGKKVLLRKSDLRTITITFLSKITYKVAPMFGFRLQLSPSHLYIPNYGAWVYAPGNYPPAMQLDAEFSFADLAGFTNGLPEYGKVYTVTLNSITGLGYWIRGVYSAHLIFGGYSTAYSPPIGSPMGMVDVPDLIEASQCAYYWSVQTQFIQGFNNELTLSQVNTILRAYGYNPLPFIEGFEPHAAFYKGTPYNGYDQQGVYRTFVDRSVDVWSNLSQFGVVIFRCLYTGVIEAIYRYTGPVSGVSFTKMQMASATGGEYLLVYASPKLDAVIPAAVGDNAGVSGFPASMYNAGWILCGSSGCN